MSRVRLAVDARMIAHSGIGTYLRNLLPHLIADPGLEVALLGDPGRLGAFPWSSAARVLPVRAGIYAPREQLELPLRVPACDVFWSPHYNVPLLPIRARRRMATIHDVFHLAYPETLSPAKRAYARLLLAGAVRLSDSVITVSEFSRREIEARLRPPAGKLSVIPNGHDAAYAEAAGPRSGSGRYLLFVGNVKPHKNLAGALEAFRAIASRHPDLRFRIVGRREGFVTGDGRVAGLAAGLGDKVEFTGQVSDREVKEAYRDALALVFPSFYEGFGLPILEAMSFGIPVLSSDRASMPEVGGDAVRYFDPGDPAAFAGALEDVVEGRWRPDPERYDSQLAKFSWNACAARHRDRILALAA